MFEVKIFFYRTDYDSSPATHGGSQTSVEFDHHELVEHGADSRRVVRGVQLRVGQDLGRYKQFDISSNTISCYA